MLFLCPTVTFAWLYSAEFFKRNDHESAMLVCKENFWSNYNTTIMYFPALNMGNYICMPAAPRVFIRLLIKIIWALLMTYQNSHIVNSNEAYVSEKVRNEIMEKKEELLQKIHNGERIIEYMIKKES